MSSEPPRGTPTSSCGQEQGQSAGEGTLPWLIFPTMHTPPTARTRDCDTRGTQTLSRVTVLNCIRFSFLIGRQLFYSGVLASAIHQHEPAVGACTGSLPPPAPSPTRSAELQAKLPLLYSSSPPAVCLIWLGVCGGSPCGSVVRIRLPMQEMCDPWVGKIPWRRKWQPTPEFVPGESLGQRRLAGYSPQGHRESDNSEQQGKMRWGSPI